jgi:hypothetical protein
MRCCASAGRFMLWETAGAFFIYDQRCPRAHAHAVWSGTHEGAGFDALSALSKNPPPFLPCAPGVVAFDPKD